MIKKICLITGLGLMALAALFVVLGVTGGPLLATSYYITAACLVFGGLFTIGMGYMLGGLGGSSKLLQTGMPGTATILSLQDTGMVINMTNQVLVIGLRVTVGANAPYDTSVRQMVPMMMMPRCQPGATIGVKVDPHDQSKVAIDWSLVPGVNLNATPAPAPAPAGVQTPQPHYNPQQQYAPQQQYNPQQSYPQQG